MCHGDVNLIITPSNPLICLSPFGEYDGIYLAELSLAVQTPHSVEQL
jgi:hypothetical protein